MELAKIVSANGQFYVPSFQILLAEKDIVRQLLIPVSGVSVDLTMKAHSRFSFTIINTYDLKENDFRSGKNESILSLLALGAEIKISMGYGTIKQEDLLIVGTITELSTSYPDSGSPELAVSGYDKGFVLAIGKISETLQNVNDSEVVQHIMARRELDVQAETLTDTKTRKVQNQQSDFEYITKLAAQHSFTFYFKEKTLYFGKPHDDAAPVVTMAWGKGLLNFKPEMNLAGQYGGVKVMSADPVAGRDIVAYAKVNDEGDPTIATNINDLLKLSTEPLLQIQHPVHSQSDANSLALALAKDIKRKQLTGDGESLGVSAIRPDTTIKLENLGERFDKTYYVEQATHKVDSGGYRTRFKVRLAK